jgi:hypothetical protein
VFILYFYLPNFCFNGEYKLHELLGGRPCGSLIPRKYINPFLVCLGVHSLTHSFIVHCSHFSFYYLSIRSFTHSSFLIHFDLGLGKKNELWRGAMVLLAVMTTGVF